MKKHFSSRQTRILLICIVLYTVLYFCRLNLSAALASLTADLGISLAAAGALQTMFAIVYACGQMVNGAIVDHVNPYRYMLGGLLGSALCNLAMGLAQGYGMMIAIWTINAVFQSMLWTPIVRVVAHEFISEQERNDANAALAVTLIAGHLFAWAISGVMADRFGWRLSFVTPAAIALVTVLVCGALVLDEMKGGQWTAGKEAKKEKQTISSISVITSAGFLLVLGTCILYGFIRDGVITWTPTILAYIGREESISPTAFSLILPLLNAAGVMLGVVLVKKGRPARRVVAMMMMAAFVCCAALLPSGGMLATAVLLGLICAAMYGANTMLTGMIPMEYDSVDKSGMTAGMIDAFIYLGSSLAGVLAGGIYEHSGMQMLCIIWMAACALGAAMMIASGKGK